MCVRIALITPEQHEVRPLTEMMWRLGVGKFSTVELSYFISVGNRGVYYLRDINGEITVQYVIYRIEINLVKTTGT